MQHVQNVYCKALQIHNRLHSSYQRVQNEPGLLTAGERQHLRVKYGQTSKNGNLITQFRTPHGCDLTFITPDQLS